jgi:hypothetical protein
MLGAVLIFQEHGILGDTSVADWSVLGFMVVIAVCTLWQAVKPPVLRGFGVLVLIQSCVFCHNLRVRGYTPGLLVHRRSGATLDRGTVCGASRAAKGCSTVLERRLGLRCPRGAELCENTNAGAAALRLRCISGSIAASSMSAHNGQVTPAPMAMWRRCAPSSAKGRARPPPRVGSCPRPGSGGISPRWMPPRRLHIDQLWARSLRARKL